MKKPQRPQQAPCRGQQVAWPSLYSGIRLEAEAAHLMQEHMVPPDLWFPSIIQDHVNLPALCFLFASVAEFFCAFSL